MNFADPSSSLLLAACGGDTVKVFDVSDESGDPCTLSYSPSPARNVNSVKWNHTNLVVASAGDDNQISLYRNNGESLGTIPLAGSDSGDVIEETISAINFSSKGSRYICSGGSGQVVRIWDLQRRRCIKRLKGHTDTITGVMYNCKDEHLASISLSGDLILHNLASGARATDLKDPNKQVLRVLDYSRISRHLLVTAGDDGSVHLWDTTGRSPKLSWLKQHTAPTAGVSFSPSSDKIIASVGMDKKLYLYDSGSRKPSYCIPYEAPFSSLAYRDDGCILAAGTTSGRVVFYDVRGKPQPITVLRAYSGSEAVSGLCWQRSRPVSVNENNCTAEIALLGGSIGDSVLMPDPLPSLSSVSSMSSSVFGSRNPDRSSMVEASSFATASGGSVSSSLHSSTAVETPIRNHLWSAGKLGRVQAPHSSYNFKDDMDMFSPLVDVQPITPSLDKLWDNPDGALKDHLAADRRPSSFLFPSFSKRYPLTEEGTNDQPMYDWRSSTNSKQDDTRLPFTTYGSTATPSSKSEDPSITPEAWGDERFLDKLTPIRKPSRLGTMTSSTLPALPDLTSSSSQMSTSSLTSSYLTYSNLQNKEVASNQDTASGLSEQIPLGPTPVSHVTKPLNGHPSLDFPGLASLTPTRRYSTYAERISTISSFSDGMLPTVGSPKTKKTGLETRDELLNSLLSRPEASAATEPGKFPLINGGTSETPRYQAQQQESSFTLQLFQRTLEETLGSFQQSVHEEMRNIHIEILRQFHLQEMEMSRKMSTILENQTEMMKEILSLRKENQQLRQML